jgi:hypothetical protein
MTAQTPLGLTYPESGDHTRLWEHFQQLAEDTDDVVGTEIARLDDAITDRTALLVQAGTVDVELSNTNLGSQWETFPVEFGATPVVVASTNDTLVVVGPSSESTTQARFWVRTVSNTSATKTVKVSYVAIGARAYFDPPT